MNSNGLSWAACGMIDQNSTFLHVVKQACFLIENNIFDIVRVSEHHEQKIRLLSNLLNFLPLGSLRDQILSLCLGSGINGQFIAIVHQVTSH